MSGRAAENPEQESNLPPLDRVGENFELPDHGAVGNGLADTQQQVAALLASQEEAAAQRDVVHRV